MTVTTPIKQREAAKASVTKAAADHAALTADHKAKGKKLAAEKRAASKPAEKPARDRSRWNDTTGHPIEKGVTVRAGDEIVGTAKHFHTHHDKDANGKDIKSKPYGMVGVELTGKGGTIKGRTIKNRSFRADELTIVTE